MIDTKFIGCVESGPGRLPIRVTQVNRKVYVNLDDLVTWLWANAEQTTDDKVDVAEITAELRSAKENYP